MKKCNLDLLNKIAKRETKPTLKETLYRNRAKVQVCKEHNPSASRAIRVKGSKNYWNKRYAETSKLLGN